MTVLYFKTEVKNGTAIHYPSLPEEQSKDFPAMDPQSTLESLWVCK